MGIQCCSQVQCHTRNTNNNCDDLKQLVINPIYAEDTSCSVSCYTFCVIPKNDYYAYVLPQAPFLVSDSVNFAVVTNLLPTGNLNDYFCADIMHY